MISLPLTRNSSIARSRSRPWDVGRRLASWRRDLLQGLREARRLFAFTRHHRVSLVTAWAASASYGATEALIVYMVKPIFDKVLVKDVVSDSWRVMFIGLAIIGLYVVKGVSSYLSTTLVANVGQHAVRDLRNTLYEHILRQSFRFVGRRSTGSLMSHVTTDIERIQTAVSETVGDLMREGFAVIFLLGVLFYYDWRLAMTSLIGMPLAFYPLVRLGRRLRASSETSLSRWRSISEILHETLSGFRIVKAFAMERFETERFRKASGRLLHVNMRITRTTAILPPLMEAVGGLALVGGLFYGSRQISSGALSTGDFASFTAALFTMYMPIKRLSRVNATLQGALAAGARVFDVLDVHEEIREAPDAVVLGPMQREVEYRDVGFRYADTQRNVLRRVSFSARSGEILAIVGMSGAGKTTLLNLLPRFYDVSEGSILIDGVDIRAATIASLRGQIGLVAQETVLFNDTVRANIAYGLQNVDVTLVENAARAALAHDFILDLPRRYETVIGERGSRLSGGQRQRIAIARAILKDPPILILDEATSSLDAESERLVQQALANLMRGRTTLVVAHRLATVRNANRIVVLDGGEVRQVGTHEELLRDSSGLYAHLHALQFRTEDPTL